ncbi:MAG TPA: hypothetical protein DDW52_00285 [Planctomycetaceae bacterium]|nr:hypothetical protein [Planctomycetaceae bacterium]
MDVPWEQAKTHLSNLSDPSLGLQGDWLQWYETAWGHLGTAGLTNAVTPHDLVVVKMRIAALCWLALDFCAAIEGNEWASVPYWNEWVSELELDPVVAALMLPDGMAHLTQDASLTDVERVCVDDENVWLIDNSIADELWPNVIMNAVFQQRDVVPDALRSGFGGLLPTFESMFACTGECQLSHTSAERMRGYQWMEECSHVLITGKPEVTLSENGG